MHKHILGKQYEKRLITSIGRIAFQNFLKIRYVFGRNIITSLVLMSFAFGSEPEKYIAPTLKFDQKELDQLLNGEFVTFEVDEETPKELSVGIAIYLPTHPEKIISYFKQNDLSKVDPEVLIYHELPKDPNENSFKEFKFIPEQLDEVNDLLSAKVGFKFNLSKEEISSLKALKKESDSWNKAQLIEAASVHYQKILLKRLVNYQKQGLKGIKPYARENDIAEPAQELAIAANASDWLKNYPSKFTKYMDQLSGPTFAWNGGTFYMGKSRN